MSEHEKHASIERAAWPWPALGCRCCGGVLAPLDPCPVGVRPAVRPTIATQEKTAEMLNQLVVSELLTYGRKDPLTLVGNPDRPECGHVVAEPFPVLRRHVCEDRTVEDNERRADRYISGDL